jgi:hypothetical protein
VDDDDDDEEDLEEAGEGYEDEDSTWNSWMQMGRLEGNMKQIKVAGISGHKICCPFPHFLIGQRIWKLCGTPQIWFPSQTVVLWVMTPCNLVGECWCFTGTYTPIFRIECIGWGIGSCMLAGCKEGGHSDVQEGEGEG